MEGLAGGLLHGQGAVVVAVQQRQGIGVVADYPQHVFSGFADQFLVGEGAGQQFYRLPHFLQFGALLLQPLFVDGVPLDDVLFENPRGPLAEAGALLRLDPVADGDDDIQVVEGNRLIGICKMHFLHIAFFVQLPLTENIPHMA